MFNMFRNYEPEMNIIVKALSDVLSECPKGFSQARDGLRCENKVIDLSDKEFSKGLSLALKRGLIVHGRPMRSVFSSYNGTPTYKIA